MGVDTFFVLSGILMAKILFVDRLSLKDFYIRRLSRVMPALVFFLVVATALSFALKYDFSVIEIISSLFFLRTYIPTEPEYFTTDTPTGHLWSLSVEEHSYVLMSLMSMLLVVRKKIAYVLLSIYAMSVVVNTYNFLSMSAQQFEYSLIRTESAIGFIAFSAGYSLLKREKNITLPKFTTAACVLLAFACYIKAAPIWLTFLVCPILLGVAVNHLTESGPIIQKLLSHPVIRHLGIFSYSIYLWQQVFYKLYYAMPYGQITGFLASIAFGSASFFLLENPVRYFINNKWSANPTYRSHKLNSKNVTHAADEIKPLRTSSNSQQTKRDKKNKQEESNPS